MSDEEEKKPRPSHDPKMHRLLKLWTDREKEILERHYEEYKTVPKHKRRTFLETGPGKEIRELTPAFKKSKNAKLWGKKFKKMREWYRDRVKKDPATQRKLAIPGISTKKTIGQVVSYKMKEEILEEAGRLRAADPEPKKNNGKDPLFPYYMEARSNVTKNLSPEEQKEIQEMLENWETKEVPREVQINTCTKKGHQVITQMDEIRFRTLGMSTLWFEYHYSDTMLYSFSETRECEHDKSAIPSFRDWDPKTYELMMGKWVEYANHVNDLQNETPKDAAKGAAPLPKQKFKGKDLNVNAHGLPQIPYPLKNSSGNETHAMRVGIIQAVFKKHHDLAGGPTRVPYQEMEKFPAWSFTDPEYFPADIDFMSSGKYKSEASEALIEHWRDRQAKGQTPFMWTHILQGKDDNQVRIPAKYKPGVIESIRSMKVDPLESTARPSGGAGSKKKKVVVVISDSEDFPSGSETEETRSDGDTEDTDTDTDPSGKGKMKKKIKLPHGTPLRIGPPVRKVIKAEPKDTNNDTATGGKGKLKEDVKALTGPPIRIGPPVRKATKTEPAEPDLSTPSHVAPPKLSKRKFEASTQSEKEDQGMTAPPGEQAKADKPSNIPASENKKRKGHGKTDTALTQQNETVAEEPVTKKRKTKAIPEPPADTNTAPTLKRTIRPIPLKRTKSIPDSVTATTGPSGTNSTIEHAVKPSAPPSVVVAVKVEESVSLGALRRSARPPVPRKNRDC